MSSVAYDNIAEKLKSVLRFMPAPVGIVTSIDPSNGDAPVGLAMSALMPVSLEPCSMAISVNRAGASHKAILRCGRFCINLLNAGQSEHLRPFADSSVRSERFEHLSWKQRDQMWFIDEAAAVIFCKISTSMSYGSHDVIVGEVYDLSTTGSTDILGWTNGALCRTYPL